MSALAGRRISEDLRYELVDAARAAEAGNRPRSLLALATVLFVAAGIALIVTLGRREAAVEDFREQSDRVVTVSGLQLQFEAMERQRQLGNGARNAPMANIFSLVEQAASEAGLRDKPPIPPDRTTSEGGATKHLYRYQVRDPSLEALLAWVERARELVPGLEVSSLEIKPLAKEWQFTITFVRWERSS